MNWRIVVLGLVVVSVGEKAGAQAACPKGDTRFYSHNDYLSARPLVDALARGYVGVEADVFLIDGELRVGHDRKEAARGARFESTYLAPLDSIAEVCGKVIPARPFLLSIEIKEESRETFDALAATLARHERLITTWVNVVHVGWHPPRGQWPVSASLFGQQYKITTTDSAEMARQARARDGTRLVSLDYGKTAGRWWRLPFARRRWIDAIGLAKAHYPQATVRVYNVPADTALRRRLWDAGTVVIGVKPDGS